MCIRDSVTTVLNSSVAEKSTDIPVINSYSIKAGNTNIWATLADWNEGTFTDAVGYESDDVFLSLIHIWSAPFSAAAAGWCSYCAERPRKLCAKPPTSSVRTCGTSFVRCWAGTRCARSAHRSPVSALCRKATAQRRIHCCSCLLYTSKRKKMHCYIGNASVHLKRGSWLPFYRPCEAGFAVIAKAAS